MKTTLDSIASDDARKREVIRGDAVDKAEQLSTSVPRYHVCKGFPPTRRERGGVIVKEIHSIKQRKGAP